MLNKKEEVLKMYENTIEEPKKIFVDRALKYGDSWKKLHVSSCIDLMMMKLERMRSDNIEYKIEDEILDIFNYAVILIMLYEREKEVLNNGKKKNMSNMSKNNK